MENNSENTNYNSVIETKKSLKRTIIQLQKAIDIINQQKITDIPNLKVVDKLVDSSNALIDYLQLRNNTFPENYPQELVRENEVIESKLSDKPPVTKTQKIAKKQSNFSLTNLILIGILTISVSLNIFNFLSPRSNNIALESGINNQLITENQVAEKEKPQEIISSDLPDNSIVSEENNNSELKNNEAKINNEIASENIPLDISKNSETVIPNNQEIVKDKPENDLSIDINNSGNKKEENNLIMENEPEESLILINPEQYLLNNIKEQIDLITNKYGKKIINKVEANLKNNSLVIEISNDWYNLNDSTQNNLVNDITVKIKSLDFYKFNLKDSEGNLLARNAIVGNEYIITQRRMKNGYSTSRIND